MLGLVGRSFLISAIATTSLIFLFAFVLGSVTYYPTVAAAELNNVPYEQQAAWLASHEKVIRGWEYAKYLAATPPARSSFLEAAFSALLFGWLCAFAGTTWQRRRAGA